MNTTTTNTTNNTNNNSTLRFDDAPVLSSVFAFGSETQVPDHDICRLSYYLKCCTMGCGMLDFLPSTTSTTTSSSTTGRRISNMYIDYQNAHRLPPKLQHDIIRVAFHDFKLESLINRAIIIDDQHLLLPPGTLNTFYEFGTAANYFSIDPHCSITGGQTRNILKVMLCTSRWMQEYYLEPFLKFARGDLLIETYAVRVFLNANPRLTAAAAESDDDDDSMDMDMDDDDIISVNTADANIDISSVSDVNNNNNNNSNNNNNNDGNTTATATLNNNNNTIDINDDDNDTIHIDDQCSMTDDSMCWDIIPQNLRTIRVQVLAPEACRAIHSKIRCDSCNQREIVGPRYTCQVCRRFHQCEMCYYHRPGSHDQTHAFQRVRFDDAEILRPRAVVVVKNSNNKRQFICESSDSSISDVPLATVVPIPETILFPYVGGIHAKATLIQ